MRPRLPILLLLSLGAPPMVAQEGSAPTELAPVVVTGRARDLTGMALTASQGLVGASELGARPWLRPGEILEVVPGFIITQHSGSGKANQYFLRGFNLDHGTDFSGAVDGVPYNLPSHGHGQGYLDLNSVIPEFIQEVDFRKGPYSAEVGNFSSAGSANLRTVDFLDRNFLKLGLGEDAFLRGVLGATSRPDPGNSPWAWRDRPTTGRGSGKKTCARARDS